MDKLEFDKLLPTLPREEHRAFQNWFVAYQDIVEWERFKNQGYKHVVEVKQAVEKHVTEITGKPQQLQLSFMPTSMGRTSPFFVMSRKEMKDRPTYQDFPVQNPWGSITISGPKLSIFDESILLALLFLAKRHKTDSFDTTYVELCETIGTSRGSRQYKFIEESLIRLAKTTTETILTKGKQNEKLCSFTGSILSQVNQDFQAKKIHVALNPHFLILYGGNLTTALNMGDRAKLKGDTAKALYRFLQTHVPSSNRFNMLTLAHAVNVDIEQPLSEIRKQIRSALAELRKQGHIERWSLDKADNVHIYRKK